MGFYHYCLTMENLNYPLKYSGLPVQLQLTLLKDGEDFTSLLAVRLEVHHSQLCRIPLKEKSNYNK